MLGAAFSPRLMLALGLMATSVINVTFGFTTGVAWWTALWALNGGLQVWQACENMPYYHMHIVWETPIGSCIGRCTHIVYLPTGLHLLRAWVAWEGCALPGLGFEWVTIVMQRHTVPAFPPDRCTWLKNMYPFTLTSIWTACAVLCCVGDWCSCLCHAVDEVVCCQ
jgi:hypothetical protein